MPAQKQNAPAAGAAEPKFSAGNVRLGIYQILNDLSSIEVEDPLTLSSLGVAPVTVRGRVNALFFPAPHAGLSASQVTGAVTTFRLINTTIHRLESQGRLKP